MKGFALAVLGFRVAYGAALVLAPQKVVKSWLGPTSDATEVALRALGAREIGIHGAGIAAVLTGADVRPWLAVSIAGDLSDVASTAVGRSGLPSGSAPKTAMVAGGSAALTAVVLAKA
jgi:hypothetical protein